MWIFCLILMICCLGLLIKMGIQKKQIDRIKNQIDFLCSRDTGTEITLERIDRSTEHLADDYPENIGFIIETPGFLPRYSGLKNLKYLASIRGRVKEGEIRKYMGLAGLNPDDKKRVGNYSLGMKQRLGIAQALMENPDILILDEPMNALDSNGVEDIRMVLLKMKENGKLIIIASHVRDDIDILCDEVHGMEGGILKKIR